MKEIVVNIPDDVYCADRENFGIKDDCPFLIGCGNDKTILTKEPYCTRFKKPLPFKGEDRTLAYVFKIQECEPDIFKNVGTTN